MFGGFDGHGILVSMKVSPDTAHMVFDISMRSVFVNIVPAGKSLLFLIVLRCWWKIDTLSLAHVDASLINFLKRAVQVWRPRFEAGHAGIYVPLRAAPSNDFST